MWLDPFDNYISVFSDVTSSARIAPDNYYYTAANITTIEFIKIVYETFDAICFQSTIFVTIRINEYAD